MSAPAQSFENHAKLVPMFHYVAFSLVMVPLVYFLYRMVTDFSMEALMFSAFTVGVLIATFFARLFPLGVQDRVIKLEETLRMQELLPDDLKGRIGELTIPQFVGLRFAPDDELPDLVRRVLDENITDRKVIKQAIKNWRADNVRI